MDIITLIKAVLLGIIEGVTEFLPVSSTGHLIITERFLRLSAHQQFVSGFEVVIQLGAILAVLVLYGRTLWPWAAPEAERPRVWRLWLRVAVGVVPAFVAGFFLEDFVVARLFRPLVVAGALIFYGAVLIAVERTLRRTSRTTISDIHAVPLGIAFAVGLFQTLALVPGTSRAAATIVGGMVLGLSRGVAAELSFFLAVPVMAGASALTLLRHGVQFTSSEWVVVAAGFVAAFLSAFVVVRAFIGYLRTRDLVPFAVYRIALGVVVIALLAFLK